MRISLDYRVSIRCRLGRHNRDAEHGCPGAFAPLFGGVRFCRCRCHRTRASRPPLAVDGRYLHLVWCPVCGRDANCSIDEHVCEPRTVEYTGILGITPESYGGSRPAVPPPAELPDSAGTRPDRQSASDAAGTPGPDPTTEATPG